MIKNTCLQWVDALPPQTLDLGSWYTAQFLPRAHKPEREAHKNNKKQYTRHSQNTAQSKLMHSTRHYEHVSARIV